MGLARSTSSDSLLEASTSCVIRSGQFSLFHGHLTRERERNTNLKFLVSAILF